VKFLEAETIKVFPEKCAECRYKGVTRINGEDFECCLGTGELILLKDLDKCPLEEVKEEKVTVEIPMEIIEKVSQSIQDTHEILLKVSNAVSKLTYTFDREDLIALIRGKTRLPLKSIKAVFNAIEKAKKVSPEHALKKFIATIGNIPVSDVTTVINQIEYINEKYGQKGG